MMTDEIKEHLITELLDRVETLEAKDKENDKRLAGMDERYAVINTKLSAILWGLGVIGAAIIGAIVKGWIP